MEKTIKFPKTAVIAIIVVIAATGVTALQTISMMSVQSASADPDRCTSAIGQGLVGIVCGETKEQQKRNKEDCRDLKDIGIIEKCSNSQTGFGTQPNT